MNLCSLMMVTAEYQIYHSDSHASWYQDIVQIGFDNTPFHITNTLLTQCFTSSSPLNSFILTALSETTCVYQFHLHFEFRWRKLKCQSFTKFCKSWAKQNLHFPCTLYFDAGRLSMCKKPFRYCFLLLGAP